MAPPADLDQARADSASALPAPVDAGKDLLGLVTDTRWVWSQYDHQLFLNTVVGPGADASVLRLKHPVTGHDTGRALALTTDGNHRWCAVDPRQGTAAVVAEAVMNLAVVGARPLAVVNCLNFGNPEHEQVMWQLSEAVDGMTEACRAFGVPVIGGNVSLYNEAQGTNIDPTPVVGVLGMIDRLDAVPPGLAWRDGDRVLLIGADESRELSGSAWAFTQGHRRGSLPSLDLAAVGAVADAVRGLVDDQLVHAAHDVSAGGLGSCLAEMAIAAGVGARLARIADHIDLFGESAGRAVVAVDAEQLTTAEERLDTAGVPFARIGLATGERLVVKDLLDVGLAELTEASERRLPDALGHGTTQD